MAKFCSTASFSPLSGRFVFLAAAAYFFGCEAERIKLKSKADQAEVDNAQLDQSVETSISVQDGGQVKLGRSSIDIPENSYESDFRVRMKVDEALAELSSEEAAVVSGAQGEVVAIEFVRATDDTTIDGNGALGSYYFEQSFDTEDQAAQFGLIVLADAGTPNERRILLPRSSLEEVELPSVGLVKTSEIRLRAKLNYPKAILWFVIYQTDATEVFDSESNSSGTSTAATTDVTTSGTSSGGEGIDTSSTTSGSSSSSSGSRSSSTSTSSSSSSGTATSGSGLTELTIFVTASAFPPTFMNLSTADGYCQTEADAATLAGTYIALLAVSVDHPRDRITASSLPIFLPSGLKVANDEADLWDGSIQNPVNEAADGSGQGNVYVWTGSQSDGSNDGGTMCGDWSGGGGFVSVGTSNDTGSSWIAGMGACGDSKRLYCIRVDE
jgi:hypothetical protein